MKTEDTPKIQRCLEDRAKPSKIKARYSRLTCKMVWYGIVEFNVPFDTL